jgi:hypothetical protein
VSSVRDDAAFYRAAILLGLLRGEDVVHWADESLARDGTPAPALVDLSTTDPGDLTALRQRLFEIAGEGESTAVVHRLLGLVQRDLASGRRGFGDTMTVLKQLRAFLKLERDLNEHVKSLGVGVAMKQDGAEQRVRAWLRQYE